MSIISPDGKVKQPSGYNVLGREKSTVSAFVFPELRRIVEAAAKSVITSMASWSLASLKNVGCAGFLDRNQI